MAVPPLFIARHAETVFNANARMQGNAAHTPLTRRGIAQAEAMAAALLAALGARPDIDIWASPTGRALQTAAIVAERLGHDFFAVRQDERLGEIGIGGWAGRSYAEIEAEAGTPLVDPARRLFRVRPPDGEWYPDIAARLTEWLAQLDPARPALVITHGITSRVLRGALVGGDPFEPGCVPIADGAPQGTIFHVEAGRERVLHGGDGASGPPRSV